LYYLPAGGTYPPFCEGLQTAWFAAGLQQIFFPVELRRMRCQHGCPRLERLSGLLCLTLRNKNLSEVSK
jgi:hypothetical protein